jgi:hypothetical protein
MKTFKVRITKSPVEQMAYGGQSGYGLDLGRSKLYTDMAELPSEGVSSTMSEEDVSNDEYVLEAEGGETIVRPDGSHFNINGPRHTANGVKLTNEQAPEGSFIFSDTKKMRMSGPMLSMFGKSEASKNKYTPAELAKQYPTNKYRALVDDPNVDPLTKKTANMMIKNNMTKLAQLALAQEGMKGFPSGIPDIAQSIMPMGNSQEMAEAMYGGYYADGGELDLYQDKGQVTPKKPQLVDKKDIARYEADGYKKVGPNLWRKQGSTIETKDPIITKGSSTTKTSPGIPAQKDQYKGPKMSNSDWLKFLQTSQGQKYKQKYITGTPGVTENVVIPDKTNCPDGYTLNPTTGVCEKTNPYSEEITIKDSLTPGNPSNPVYPNYTSGRLPFFGSSLGVAPYKEQFYGADMDAMIPEPTFYDPERELAANAEQANITQGYAANFSNPQAFMANASAVQGNASKAAADTLGRYNNLNVGVANQFSPLQTDIMNKVMAYRADRADKLFFNNQQGNKMDKNNLRQWMNNIEKYRINDYVTKTGIGMENATNPYFDLVPGRGQMNMQMKPGTDWYSAVTGQSAATPASSEQDLAEYLKAAKEYESQGIKESVFMPALKRRFPGMFTTVTANSGRGNQMANYANPYMNLLNMYGARAASPLSMIDADYE